MLKIFVDADGCPVKEEIYKVAARHSLPVIVVANHSLRTPLNPRIEMVVVTGGFDVADDWIAEKIEVNDIAVTADIPLADRCLKKGARALGTKGVEFTPDSIGDALATRELLQTLRNGLGNIGGPAPFEKKDRSQFLAKLDQIIQSIKHSAGIKK